MESDGRYYARRAAEEAQRAARAITPEAREWHRQLAQSFSARSAGGIVPVSAH
jgi:hypothetical protein